MTTDLGGANGMNARINGISRDQLWQAHSLAQGGMILLMDDADAVREAKAHGLKVIYRQSGDQSLFDDIPSENEAALRNRMFAFLLERANKGADYIHFFNEVAWSPRLSKLHKIGLEICVDQGWKGVILNFGPNSPAAWFENERDNIAEAVAHDMLVGVHVYLQLSDPSNDHSIDHRDGAWEFLKVKHDLGGLWVGTEVNFIRSIFNGEQGPKNFLGLNGRPTLSQFARNETPSFDRENIPRLWFSADPWPPDADKKQNGFGYWDDDDFLKTLGQLNQTQRIREVHKMVTNFPTLPAATDTGWKERVVASGSGVRIRSSPQVIDGGILASFSKDDHLFTWSLSGLSFKGVDGTWVPVKNTAGVVGWSRTDVFTLTDLPTPTPVPVPTPAPQPGVDGAQRELDAARDRLATITALEAEVKTHLDNATALLKGVLLPVTSGGGGF